MSSVTTMNAVRIEPFITGTLRSGTPVAVACGGAPMPMSITLKSSAGGRALKISTDGGVEFFTPVMDATSATMLVVAVRAPISHAQFTGVDGDTWSIR